MRVKKDIFVILKRNTKKKRLIILSSLFLIFFLMPVFENLNFNGNSFVGDQISFKDFPVDNLKSQDISSDSIFSGIGSAWNVTHYANRTKTNLEVSFNNNSYNDLQYVELDNGWMGYQLNSTIKNLYDTRNWINGTFHAGDDDGNTSPNDVDPVANWTFTAQDVGIRTNFMSGNYFDDSNPESKNQDCLELKIEGNAYDIGDKCWWEANIEMDRGEVDEAWLSFGAFPKYGDQYNNHWVLQVIANNKTLWGNGLASMLEACGNSTHGQWYNPPDIYLNPNDDQLFPSGIKNMNITLEFKRVSGNTNTGTYASEYSVLFDNVTLIVKSKAKPSHLDLKLNNKNVIDTNNYGEGYCGSLGNWNGSLQSSVRANFSSNVNWPLTFEEDGSWLSYKIDLDTNLTLYVNKSTPESYYIADPDLSYQGSSFITSNNSNVNWTTYAHMEIPTGYEETNIL